MSRKPPSRAGRVRRLAFALSAVAALVACATPLGSGEFGPFRLAGRVKGQTPLALLPPVADRAGNVYVLYGGIDVPETGVFAGKAGGGWFSGCALTKGDVYGAHGWVGFTDDRQFYWSGDALVSVSGRTGDCHAVLDRDPGTDANLLFRAVLPWVRDAPSRQSLVALVQSPVDLLPYSARVDLESEVLTDVRPFEPAGATAVRVLGVGARREENYGVVFLQYDLDGASRTEARWYDEEANRTATVGLDLPPADREHTVQGYLQIAPGGLVAGVLRDGSLLTFDERGGRTSTVTAMDAVGVHLWKDSLYVVGVGKGEGDGRPVLAKIEPSARVGPTRVWAASERAARALARPIDVRDDRELPSTATRFDAPRTAMGPFPFIHPHTLAKQGEDTSLWLVAGPSFDTGGASVTAFAMAPVGVTYP